MSAASASSGSGASACAPTREGAAGLAAFAAGARGRRGVPDTRAAAEQVVTPCTANPGKVWPAEWVAGVVVAQGKTALKSTHFGAPNSGLVRTPRRVCGVYALTPRRRASARKAITRL